MMINFFEFLFSTGITLNICLVMFAICRVVNLIYKSQLKNELGMKAFDYTKSSKRKEYDKNTLEVVIYLIGIVGGLLIAAAGFLSSTGLNTSMILFSGIGILLFGGVLFGYLKFSKN